jgi:hypothetical protein
MHDPMTFEASLAQAYGRYADEADADVAGCYFTSLQWLPEVSQ